MYRLIILLFLLIHNLSFSQKRYFKGHWELGGLIGASNYHGDLARNIVLKESHPAAAILGKFNFSSYFSYRFGLGFATISGSDANHKDYKVRNLSFKSNIWELSNHIEFNFRPFGANVLDKKSTFFVFMGLNFFRFNPKAEYLGEWHELRNLGTEGQIVNGKKKYNLIQPSIPLGFGYKYQFGKRRNWTIGAEVGFRKTYTDYIDDVSGKYPDYQILKNKQGELAANLSHREDTKVMAGSMRGDSHLKDYYIIGGISLFYKFTPIACFKKL